MTLRGAVSYDRSGSARKVARWAPTSSTERRTRAGGRCQGGIDPVLDSAGVAAHRGIARRGSDRARWRTLRPQRPVSRRAPSWEQPRDGRVGRPARADSRAPDSPCHGARDSTAVYEALHGDRAVNDLVEARAVSHAATTRRRGDRGDGLGSRAFERLRDLIVVALVLDGKTFAEADRSSRWASR